MTLSITILGCGSSGGVPRVGGDWGACDPNNPKNVRRRCSILVERIGAAGRTSVLIDTSPDLRMQLLDARVNALDAVLYTHPHADHVHGIDDLRPLVINSGQLLNVYADANTAALLRKRFDYVFETPKGSDYPPILGLNLFETEVVVEGAGGTLQFTALPVQHGRTEAFGFRVNDMAYIPDVSDIGAQSWDQLKGLDVFIIDALRRKPHPSHAHLEKTLGWIAALGPKRAVLTNMHSDLDYETLAAETPDHVSPAYDGMTLTS